MIRDQSIKIADNLLDEESSGTICTISTDDDRDIKKMYEDLDSLDYCDYQNNQFPKERTPPCGDQSIKTITNSNRNATSQFPENSSLSPLPCPVTSRPLSSAVLALSAHPDMNHSFPKTHSDHDDPLLQPLHLGHLDCMDNPLDASQHSSNSCSTFTSFCATMDRYV